MNWNFFGNGAGERLERSRASHGWRFGAACVAALQIAALGQAEPDAGVRSRIVGGAVLEEGAYRLLETLSDEFGPRMIGTEGHRRSMDYLEGELQALGLETRRQRFEYPGWRRGEAEVRILEPVQRSLRAAELGYVGTSSDVEGRIEYLDTGDLDALESRDLQGKILLLKPNLSFSHEELLALSERGAVAALLINRVDGGQLLARVANHHGELPPFPLLSITQEEGFWMRRLVEDGESARLSINTGASNHMMEGANLIATLPGTTGETVVVGGHFDSWDMGQGAIDNGLGVAQVYETARLLARHSLRNRHTLELVWFDAEEFGLWGSYHYAEEMDRDAVRVMLNLDMVGRPIALNAMGFQPLVEPLQAFSDSLGSWSFTPKVANKTWLGSDHHPFILKGVPAVTFNAPLDHEDARFYHDFADTFDKIDREMLGRASAIVALLAYQFANDESPMLKRLSEEETAELFRQSGAEARMKRAGQWPFSESD